MDQAPALPNVTLDADGRIDQDLLCIKCGYNLRGLDPNSVCPECNTAIGRSLRGDLLQFRDPDWLEILVSGMNWIVTGIALHLVFSCLVTPLLAAIGGAAGAGGARLQTHPVSLLVQIALQLVGFVGYWKVTSPDPGGMESEQDLTARKVARIALIIELAMLPVTAMIPVLMSMGLPLIILLGVASWIIGLVWQFAILIYARRLALRVPDEKLARNTRTVMWGLVIPVVNIIFIIWALVLIEKYRTHLRQAAKAARQTWAAPPGLTAQTPAGDPPAAGIAP